MSNCRLLPSVFDIPGVGAFIRGPLPIKTTGGKIKIKAGKLAANQSGP